MRKRPTIHGYSFSALLIYLFLKYIIGATDKKGATYAGFTKVLGWDERSVFRAVKKAVEEGLVKVEKTGHGRGYKAVIYPKVELTWESEESGETCS